MVYLIVQHIAKMNREEEKNKHFVLGEDPIYNLDEEESKTFLMHLKKTSKPTVLTHLKNAKIEGNRISFDLKITKKKK